MWAGFGGPRASLANVAAVAAVLCDPERADQEKKNPNPSLLVLLLLYEYKSTNTDANAPGRS